jgi:hypothetical protein
MLSVEKSTHGSSPLINDNLIDSLIGRKRTLKNNYYRATFLLSDLKNRKLSSYLESKTNDLNLLFNVLPASFLTIFPKKTRTNADLSIRSIQAILDLLISLPTLSRSRSLKNRRNKLNICSNEALFDPFRALRNFLSYSLKNHIPIPRIPNDGYTHRAQKYPDTSPHSDMSPP